MSDKNKFLVDGKYIQILNDFVLCEDSCNMNCDYCLSENASLKENHDFGRVNGMLNFSVRDSVSSKDYGEESYGHIVDSVLGEYDKFFYSPILKLSGGEVFLIKHFINLLEKYSPRYEVIQVLTNGTLINDVMIDRLGAIQNLNIQLSMDGHTVALNNCRVKSELLQEKLNNTLVKLVRRGIPVEIYCVISTMNCRGIESFVQYLHDSFGESIHFIPFPVRYTAKKQYGTSSEDIIGLENILDKYDKYKIILPPSLYIQEMINLLKCGRRIDRCFVPEIMFQSFDDGVVTPCPNCWTVDIGNLLLSPKELLDNYHNEKVYTSMTNNPSTLHLCRKCWTDYHLLNLYFSNRLSLKCITEHRQLLSGPKVKQCLKKLKEIIIGVNYE